MKELFFMCVALPLLLLGFCLIGIGYDLRQIATALKAIQKQIGGKP